MVKVLNRKLKRTIGITFSYKEFFSEFLHDLETNPVVIESLSSAEEEAYSALVKKYDLSNPSMGFSTKQFAYEALEIVCKALVADSDIPADSKPALNRSLLDVARYVGLEGEEDFHFQVATYNLAEVVSRIVGEVVAIPKLILGGIASFRVFEGGSGYTNGLAEELTLISTEIDDSDPAEVTLDIVGNKVVLGTYTTDDPGDGFFVGQIVTVEDLLGNVGDAYTTPALAVVETLA
jgi:hypothetical protein